jgi:hypothetical protein
MILQCQSCNKVAGRAEAFGGITFLFGVAILTALLWIGGLILSIPGLAYLRLPAWFACYLIMKLLCS